MSKRTACLPRLAGASVVSRHPPVSPKGPLGRTLLDTAVAPRRSGKQVGSKEWSFQSHQGILGFDTAPNPSTFHERADI